MGTERLAIDPEDVAAAADRIAGVANRTPVFRSRSLDERLGATGYLKAESFQRGGAFKFRGAYNAVASLSPEDLARYLFERQKPVVEPSGSSALAAVLSGLVDVRGLRVGVVLPGGNIAVERFMSLLADLR